MTISRRRFLGRTAAGAGVFALGPVLGDAVGATPDPKNDHIIVLLQLSGGNDGISTIVPYANDVYHQSRQRTRIAEKDVLKIDDHVGFHPNLKGFRELWSKGRLAVVQGVGYPEPNRSHFKSYDIWHTASNRGRSVGRGWIGHLCDVAFAGTSDPNLVIHVGNRTPYSLHSTAHPPVAFSTPRAYKWVGTPEEVAALETAAPDCERMPATAGGAGSTVSGRDRALVTLRRALREAQASSTRVRDAAARFRPKTAYPRSRLAASLATVSALITGGLSTRVYSVEAGGFDTHNNQRPRHDNLMTQLGDGVLAFFKDLEAHGVADRVVVMGFSEFGRRVRENGSGGTDHGVAGPSFLMGPKVKGGLFGRHPSLTDLVKGDLKHTTDFRRLYATVIDGWVGADHVPVLGRRWDTLPIIRS